MSAWPRHYHVPTYFRKYIMHITKGHFTNILLFDSLFPLLRRIPISKLVYVFFGTSLIDTNQIWAVECEQWACSLFERALPVPQNPAQFYSVCDRSRKRWSPVLIVKVELATKTPRGLSVNLLGKDKKQKIMVLWRGKNCCIGIHTELLVCDIYQLPRVIWYQECVHQENIWLLYTFRFQVTVKNKQTFFRRRMNVFTHYIH